MVSVTVRDALLLLSVLIPAAVSSHHGVGTHQQPVFHAHSSTATDAVHLEGRRVEMM
jgi:hypothetical protein